MLRFLILFIVILGLSACARDESIANFVEPTAKYHLVELDNAPFVARATIQFPEAGRIVGKAPCNSYFAAQTVPYPWFGLEGIGATRMACGDMAAEATFFAALEDMTLAEVAGDTLILSNPSGRQMVFVAR